MRIPAVADVDGEPRPDDPRHHDRHGEPAGVRCDRSATIIDTSPGDGRIEASVTTPFFGFIDDVVIRVTPDGAGSRVDVRSVSRIGGSDIGANARRIRSYLDKLRARAG